MVNYAMETSIYPSDKTLCFEIDTLDGQLGADTSGHSDIFTTLAYTHDQQAWSRWYTDFYRLSLAMHSPEVRVLRLLAYNQSTEVIMSEMRNVNLNQPIELFVTNHRPFFYQRKKAHPDDNPLVVKRFGTFREALYHFYPYFYFLYLNDDMNVTVGTLYG